MSSLTDGGDSKRKDDVSNKSVIKDAADKAGEQTLLTTKPELSDEIVETESIADIKSNETDVVIESAVRSLPVSDSRVTAHSVTVSGLNVLSESIPVFKCGPKSELDAICESDSSSESISSSSVLLCKSISDCISSKEQVKPITVVVPEKCFSSKTIESALDSEQDMVFQSLSKPESVPLYNKTATPKQDTQLVSSPVSKQGLDSESNTPLKISLALEQNFKPSDISDADTKSLLILDSESPSELKTITPSECSASVITSRETVEPESNTVTEISTAPDSNNGPNIVSALHTVSQSGPDSEVMSTLQTTSVSEQCIKFASIKVLEENVALESITELDEIHTGFSPALEPSMVLHPGIAVNSVLVSEVTPIYETIAVLEQDVTLKESKDLESDDVIEIIGDSDPLKSELYTISESAELPTKTCVSEENVTLSPISMSKGTANEKSATAVEIEAASGTFFEPRPLTISSNQTGNVRADSVSSVRHRRFCIYVDVSNLENLSVNIIGDKVDIYGLQKSEYGDEHHEVHQIHAIPEFVDNNDLTASIQENGKLLIEAPVKKKVRMPVTEL